MGRGQQLMDSMCRLSIKTPVCGLSPQFFYFHWQLHLEQYPNYEWFPFSPLRLGALIKSSFSFASSILCPRNPLPFLPSWSRSVRLSKVSPLCFLYASHGSCTKWRKEDPAQGLLPTKGGRSSVHMMHRIPSRQEEERAWGRKWGRRDRHACRRTNGSEMNEWMAQGGRNANGGEFSMGWRWIILTCQPPGLSKLAASFSLRLGCF